MNGQPAPGGGGWTNSATRAAWTLLLVAGIAWVAWQFLQPLLAPIITLLALVGLCRFALGLFRGGDRW